MRRNWCYRTALLSVSAILFLFLPLGVGAAGAQPPPTLGMSKTYFTVNGQPKFLTFISYFAALRPTGSAWGAVLTPTQRANHLAEVESHFQTFKSVGFDGVRIFPNWAWSFTIINGCDVTDPNTVMRASAGAPVPSPIPGKPATTFLNTQQLELLHQVLLAAGRQQLIVEVAWNNEQVRTINPANNAVLDRLTGPEYAAALGEVVTQFSGLHPHMYYDLHNEYNHGVASATCPKEVYGAGNWGSVVGGLRAIDPTRRFTASFTAAPSTTQHQSSVEEAYTATFDMVSYHDPRNYSGTTALWPAQTTTHVNGLRAWIETRAPSSQWKPVLFSEPDRWLCCSSPENALTATNFRTAVANAKVAGAAGWTFHTEIAFKNAIITGAGIAASVAPGLAAPGGPELDFINTFSTHIAPVVWGIPRLAGSVDTPAPGATVNQTFSTSGWILDRAAANAGATTMSFYRSNTPNVPQVFVGSATVVARPDVASIYGPEYLNSGFAATLTFPVGAQHLVFAVTDHVNGATYFFSIPLNVVP